MIHLRANIADQHIYLTLKEGQANYATTSESYLFVLEPMSNEDTLYFVADVVVDLERYTKIRVSTTASQPTSGNVQILRAGDWSYTVYGQTGTTNLDPTNEAVIGVWEVGTLRVSDTTTYYDADSETIPPFIVRR